ncbi:Eco57I restriction-modification methylase domain-containing protein [Paraburkholderia sp. BL25I1N1]|uniref:Eco57I restriction-modification methylase domain-containing protein n=1 Tax=Paraburkholderia sp. BL25I1N1 TaxID=1938804 RepID=UPI000D073814|nr:hypothetical protein [Paraburkholderia sp. BL25I1N1]PRY04412.1 hypothetical protein B0G73_11288 [Paraburkholderia sp. BL25I1N1]
MTRRLNYKNELGQHMTPVTIANMLCQQLPRGVTVAIDLAVGDGALLHALRGRWKKIELYGVDCDRERVTRAARLLGPGCAGQGDGLTARLPSRLNATAGRTVLIGNPPYFAVESRDIDLRLQRKAFPGVSSKHGLRRIEMTFFSRALIEARRRKGVVAMILPSAFAAGIQYAPYRAALLEHYRVLKAIEIQDGGYRDTEATTILLIIDTACRPTREVEISRYTVSEDEFAVVYRGRISRDQRLDARYWAGAHLHQMKAPTLGEVGADISRGRRSKAEALKDSQIVLHTTDLCRLEGRRIRLPDLHLETMESNDVDVMAEAKDFLIARTGTRVRWEPIEVAAGSAPISDHVLRIRAPKGFYRAIKASLLHPNFSNWLASISKGVCATVLTKRELLQMPLFAMQGKCNG